MTLEEIEESLLEKAREEERKYNWVEAAKSYEIVAKSYLDKKMVKKAADVYNKLGISYRFAIETAETTEDYLEQINCGIKAYRKAINLFKQTRNKPMELECRAEIFYISTFVTDSIMEQKEMLISSMELFIEAGDLFYKREDQKSIARTLSRGAWISSFLLVYLSDPNEIEKVSQKCREIAKRSWVLSKEIKNIQYTAESLFGEEFSILAQIFTTPFKGDERWKEYFRQFRLRCDETLKLFDDSDNFRALGVIYLVVGATYCWFSEHYIEDEKEQTDNFDKGLIFLKKALFLAREAKNKWLIILSQYYLNWMAFRARKFKDLQKRIMSDLKEIMELGRIYSGSFSSINFLSNFLPAFYYSNLAQRSFFPTTQRKSYAKKGIEYAKESLKMVKSLPFAAWPYQMLTWSYSQLVVLSSRGDDRDEYSQLMLKYAKKAEKIGEKYEGGFTRAAEFSSLYRAYKTLADTAQNVEERIKMLTAAIDSQEKYMDYATESRTGVIAAQMGLGLLYEELGILTRRNETIFRARELFLDVIKGSLDRRYYSYAGTTYEYIARIEDRLGNHTTSADYYLKAQENHTKSFESIGYRLLKKRIKEKIDYAHAWNLIEMAKANHRNEGHLKAKECYEKSSEILQKIPRYSFEGYYNAAWALLEEAELLSKQERQEEAINQYKDTIQAFEETIKILRNALEKAEGQPERERIDKLQKVAKVRINYCDARINLEEARILGKTGDHSTAAEKFAMAASVFRTVCTRYKLERERKELEAIYYLCRAWESMELAEKFEEPERFSYAANLFTKASKLFVDTKLKLLASGNSAFCQALELSCKFDESMDISIKMDLYPKVKLMLSKAASSYGKSGFENVADWALATSIYFDAAWHLIQADKEPDISKKGRLLGIGSNYLKSTLEIFSKAGYKNKVVEVQDRLNRVEKEESILFSALSTIKEPSISRSTLGIIAPSCPIESSRSPRLGEARQFTEEERRVLIEKMEKKKEVFQKDLEIKELKNTIKIFISYATEDSKKFKIPIIAKTLTKYPLIETVLYWEEDLHDDIYDYMDSNLGKCDIFLLFCSQNALKSDAVKMEWRAALKIKKKIIPVFRREQDIPTLLSTKLGVQFNESDLEGTNKSIYDLILKKLEI